MVALTELSGCFDRPSEDARPWRHDNPMPVPTERERYVLEQALPVYRVLYRRNQQPLPDRTDWKSDGRRSIIRRMASPARPEQWQKRRIGIRLH